MEHTNLLSYKSSSDLISEQGTGGTVTTIRPGVAHVQNTKIVSFNKKKTTYFVTVNHKRINGDIISAATTVESGEVMPGKMVKVKILPIVFSGYVPVSESQKIETSGNTNVDYLYKKIVNYTLTVNYTCSGETLDTDEIITEEVPETDFINVTLTPKTISGFVPVNKNPITLRVSGDTNYVFEYLESSYEMIDLGLPSGTLWASVNIGADSPEKTGDYFAWGETTPKTSFTQANYVFFDSSTGTYTKYTDSGVTLDLADDAASVNMGDDWHIPTPAQYYELLNNTTSSLTEYNGVSGLLLASKTNENTLFFPGAILAGENMVDQAQEFFSSALTWTNFLASGPGEFIPSCFDIYEAAPEVFNVNRYYGMPVRGVIGEATDVGPI